MSGKRYIVPKMLFIGSMIPEWLEVRQEPSPGCKLVYARLCRYSNNDGRAWPSQATLGDSVGLKERQTRTYVEECEKHGIIEIDQRGLGRTNVYLFPAHDWMGLGDSKITQRVPDTAGLDRQDAAGLFQIVGIESIETLRDAAAPPASDAKAGKKRKKERSPQDVEKLRVQGEWFGYAKGVLDARYPGYKLGGKQEAGLSRILKDTCGGDLARAKAFLQCAINDNDPFLVKMRHDPAFLHSKANRWLTSSTQWVGYKENLAATNASIDDRRLEFDRQRAEALDEEVRIAGELAALSDSDREGLRVEYLATFEDERFRARLASADWRKNAVLAGGMYAVLRRRQLERVRGVV